MTMVVKRWDNTSITIDERWLARAKALLQEHGITETTRVAEIMEEEFVFERFSTLASRIIVIAMRELDEEQRPNPAQLRARLSKMARSQICLCRCWEGSNCGGCGHDGCGYTKSAWELKA